MAITFYGSGKKKSLLASAHAPLQRGDILREIFFSAGPQFDRIFLNARKMFTNEPIYTSDLRFKVLSELTENRS